MPNHHWFLALKFANWFLFLFHKKKNEEEKNLSKFSSASGSVQIKLYGQGSTTSRSWHFIFIYSRNYTSKLTNVIPVILKLVIIIIFTDHFKSSTTIAKNYLRVIQYVDIMLYLLKICWIKKYQIYFILLKRKCIICTNENSIFYLFKYWHKPDYPWKRKPSL
jgi:hypothetical protein